MRYDSLIGPESYSVNPSRAMMIRNKCLWWGLLVSASVFLVLPNAQSKPAKKKAKTHYCRGKSCA